MNTTTKPAPKQRQQQPARTATLTTLSNGKLCLWITAGKDTRAYVLQSIPTSWGVAWQLGKADNGDGSMENYCVLIDLEHHRHSCDCAGFCFRSKCKHVEALEALIAAGKLPGPAPKSKPVCLTANADSAPCAVGKLLQPQSKKGPEPMPVNRNDAMAFMKEHNLFEMKHGEVREINGHRVERTATGWMVGEQLAMTPRQLAEILTTPRN